MDVEGKGRGRSSNGGRGSGRSAMGGRGSGRSTMDVEGKGTGRSSNGGPGVEDPAMEGRAWKIQQWGPGQGKIHPMEAEAVEDAAGFLFLLIGKTVVAFFRPVLIAHDRQNLTK
ncbi:hypothetical protein JTE90_019307 [Oedothorax gibbosus]|uniref:Uncharacterized protein n=1 Tax=Oedothorax gibbosus TaxID=931172 RepID=A0AAV6TIA4_9ARAC|nr:hypothetical protein JTE90_019307 [Oedothorax gibbosus]